MFFKSRQFLVCYAFAVALLLVSATSSRLTRQKRSDDGSPLEAVVEQLTQQVTTLNAEVAALKTKTAILDKTVAFHVWNSANPVLTTPHGTIVLNHAATNIGNAYNTLTGVFTAPVSGLYDFQTSIMSYYLGAGQYTHCAIYVDDDIVGITISDSQHGSYSQSTIRAIVHVHAGQKVYLKNTDNTARAYFDTATDPYTAFSGFLVKAD